MKTRSSNLRILVAVAGLLIGISLLTAIPDLVTTIVNTWLGVGTQ